ncbi:MAG: fructosamine kinase family protein [Xanthomonadales bacterium]|nr:fructosamine kinase family protein [Xanthomonadales bacterium]
MSVSDDLLTDLCLALDVEPGSASLTPVGGGDSHRAARLESDGRRWFVKWNTAACRPFFETEMNALTALAVAGGPVVPRAVTAGGSEEHAWLVTEWLAFARDGDAADFGRRLARLHRQSHRRFGWHENNFLGGSPQDNRPGTSWPEFWWSRRLAPQLDRARVAGLDPGIALPELEAASARLLGHAPAPSLVHGDLWGGNHGYLADGSPVIFDPAPYFGDRETDLAMMELFGGFDRAVFQAYETTWPLPAGADDRRTLYQLYHLLNHFNLFGPGWASRVERSIRSVLRAAAGAH